jgi:hypothetical protein
MKLGTRFWALAVMVGTVEMVGLSIGAPRVQALIAGTGAEAALKTGRSLAAIGWSKGTNAATSVATSVVCQAIRGATTLLALVDRVSPEPVLLESVMPERVMVGRVIPRIIVETGSCERTIVLRELEGCGRAAACRAARMKIRRAELLRIHSMQVVRISETL